MPWQVAAESGPLCAREPWRLACGYARDRRIDVRPRRDSPLWVMSVNRVNWPECAHVTCMHACHGGMCTSESARVRARVAAIAVVVIAIAVAAAVVVFLLLHPPCS